MCRIDQQPGRRLGRRGLAVFLAAWVAAVVFTPELRAEPLPGDAPAATADVDATAIAGAEGSIPTRNLLSIIQDGGVLMYPIIFCSFIMLVFVFERSISLRRGRVIPGPFVKRFLHRLHEGQLDREEALRLCEDNGSPVAGVFAAAVRKWGRPGVEIEQSVLDAGERAVNELRRYVRLFNAISTITPLLGLLGTVFGMIRSFNDIAAASAMGRAELLAAGISEALLTTAAGLSVAIPALTIYLFFVSRVDRLTIDIDALGQEVAEAISSEGLVEMPTQKSARAPKREAA
jgi:biopolymer transport protein ExbB